LVYLEVPVKKTGGDLAGRMVIGGLTADRVVSIDSIHWNDRAVYLP
jgi:hypothetical protein